MERLIMAFQAFPDTTSSGTAITCCYGVFLLLLLSCCLPLPPSVPREAACEDSPRTPVPLLPSTNSGVPRELPGRESEVRLIILQAPCLQLPCAAQALGPKVMVSYSQTFSFQVPAINPSSLPFLQGW